MTIRLLGLSDEQRLEFEQSTGIKTEAAQIIIDESVRQAQTMLDTATKEIQSIVGPHGTVSRIQAGGVRISPGMGIGVFADGVLKTTIGPDGSLFVGSNIDDPTTTTLSAFVNDQVYNNEQMGAGDLLIGDNSAANMLYDASEGQLQFRYGSTVNVYIDTDGTLKAGAGSVKLDSEGITFTNNANRLRFLSSDNVTVGGGLYFSIVDDLQLVNFVAGKSIKSTITLSGAATPYMKFSENPSEANTASLVVNGGADTGTTVNIGGDDVVISANRTGETVFNEHSHDIDFRVEGDTDTKLLMLDAGLDGVGMGGDAESGYKLKVTGNLKVTGTVTGSNTTDEYLQDTTGAMVTGNTETGIAVTYDDTNGKLNFDAQTAGDLRYAPINKGVTSGDSHNHSGVGVAPAVDHESLTAIGTNSHDDIDTFIGTTVPATYAPIDGWVAKSDTWTRTGNHTFTVSGDFTATFRKGAKVRYKDGGSYEYGVVGSSTYSSPNTTITLITNSDYAMAAATITDKYISYIEIPEGFPAGFTFAQTYTGFSADPTQTVKWSTVHNRLFLSIATTSNGTSNATTFTMSLPVTVAQGTIQFANVTDNGTEKNGIAYAAPSTTTLTYYAGAFGAAFVNSGTKGGSTALSYLF